MWGFKQKRIYIGIKDRLADFFIGILISFALFILIGSFALSLGWLSLIIPFLILIFLIPKFLERRFIFFGFMLFLLFIFLFYWLLSFAKL